MTGLSAIDIANATASDASQKARGLEIRVKALEGLVRAAGIVADEAAVMAAIKEIEAEREVQRRAERDRMEEARRARLTDKEREFEDWMRGLHSNTMQMHRAMHAAASNAGEAE